MVVSVRKYDFLHMNDLQVFSEFNILENYFN